MQNLCSRSAYVHYCALHNAASGAFKRITEANPWLHPDGSGAAFRSVHYFTPGGKMLAQETRAVPFLASRLNAREACNLKL